MVMNGFDTNFDRSNEVYAVNTVALRVHGTSPIRVKRGELVRIYLVNALEFDLLNSFHIHANFFDYYPTGTSLEPRDFTDTVIQGQGERGILELRFPYAGKYMFHAHVSRVRRARLDGLLRGRGLMEAATSSVRRPPGSLASCRWWCSRWRSACSWRSTRPGSSGAAACRRSSPSSGRCCGRGRSSCTSATTAATRSRRAGDRQRRLRRRSRQSDAEIGRLGGAEVMIEYPWIEGEELRGDAAHLDRRDVDHAIDAAAESPDADVGFYGLMALIGLYVGVIPVAIGMLWLPWVRAMDAALDALRARLHRRAARVPRRRCAARGHGARRRGRPGASGAPRSSGSAPRAPTWRWRAWTPGCAGARRADARCRPARRRARWLLVALGIGLHNLGEGLAIGSAYAVGVARPRRRTRRRLRAPQHHRGPRHRRAGRPLGHAAGAHAWCLPRPARRRARRSLGAWIGARPSTRASPRSCSASAPARSPR